MNNGFPPGGTVHLEYAKIPKTPEPPRPTMRCTSCRHWQRDQKQRVAQVQGGGQVAISQLIAAGMKIPPVDLIVTIAPCAFNPIWSMVTDDHWCWQFVYDRRILEPNLSDIEDDANSV